MQNSQIDARTPPKEVRDRLRREVNFGCPICRSPFLTYHHFAPVWELAHTHHEPGMIALCHTHHDFADAGNYPAAYLHNLKVNPPDTPPDGRLPWSAERIFIMFGGNYFVTTPGKTFSFRVDGREVFALRPSDVGYLSINAAIYNSAGDLVCQIVENDIIANLAKLGDLICTAKGKEVTISSQPNDATLSLKYERKQESDLLPIITSQWPKTFSRSLKLDKTQKVRGFIKSALDSDMLCPVITIQQVNIKSATVPIDIAAILASY
jgi:hypothetical protein